MQHSSLVVLFTLLPSVACAESAMRFVDLRVQGGVVQDSQGAGHIELMAGDIGNNEQHLITLGPHLGVVLGGRGSLMDATVRREDTAVDLDLKLAGGAVLGGLGVLIAKNTHLEILAGWGGGVGSVIHDDPWDDHEATYRLYQGEVGLYHTFGGRVQIGVFGGYSFLRVTYEDVGGEVKAKSDGFDAGGSLGVRF